MMQRMLATLLLIVFSLTIDVSANEPSVNYRDPPDWIKQQSIPKAENIPVDDLDGGIYHLLVDDQVSAGGNQQPQYYTHIALYIANRSGLEEASQLSIEFDPLYESLDIHSLRIRRGDDIIDRLQTTKLNLLQRESELDDSIIDGRLTASFILEDVRVGDIVEYSYTIAGDNPVYQGIFSYSRFVQWSVPVELHHLRVLWSGREPLHVSYQHTDQRFEKKSVAMLSSTVFSKNTRKY